MYVQCFAIFLSLSLSLVLPPVSPNTMNLLLKMKSKHILNLISLIFMSRKMAEFFVEA